MRAGLRSCAKKAQTASSEGGRKETSRNLVQGKAHRDQANSGDAGDTGCQTIQSIQPVDGIGDADQPDQRRQKAEAIAEDDR